jgi:hypothetical protein
MPRPVKVLLAICIWIAIGVVIAALFGPKPSGGAVYCAFLLGTWLWKHLLKKGDGG